MPFSTQKVDQQLKMTNMISLSSCILGEAPLGATTDALWQQSYPVMVRWLQDPDASSI
jgi:hypothetical protein